MRDLRPMQVYNRQFSLQRRLRELPVMSNSPERTKARLELPQPLPEDSRRGRHGPTRSKSYT